MGIIFPHNLFQGLTLPDHQHRGLKDTEDREAPLFPHPQSLSSLDMNTSQLPFYILSSSRLESQASLSNAQK